MSPNQQQGLPHAQLAFSHPIWFVVTKIGEFYILPGYRKRFVGICFSCYLLNGVLRCYINILETAVKFSIFFRLLFKKCVVI